MEGIERLEKEVAELNNCSITKIFNYLKTRTDLYEKFNNEEKTAENMYDYIYEKTSKHQHKHMAVVDDNVVYLWAVTYFTKSNEELGINKEKKVMPTTPNEVIAKNEERLKQEENKQKDTKLTDNQITLFQEV